MRRPEQLARSPVTIHPLTKEDVPFLLPVLFSSVIDHETGQPDQDEIEAILGYMQGNKDEYGRSYSYLIAKNALGRPIGCIACTEPDSDMLTHFQLGKGVALELLNFFVHKDERGQGIGRQLFDAACSFAKDQNKRFLLINSGPRYQETSWAQYSHMCGPSRGLIRDKYGPGYHANTWRVEI